MSTRGSCDALVALLLLGALRAALARRPASTGALLGCAVHLRVYPLVHSLPLALFFLPRRAPQRALRACARALAPAAAFGAAAAATFAALGGACYHIYGDAFLHEAYLYHAGRSDPRHNFSPAFYAAYLRHAAPGALTAAARAATLAQVASLTAAGIALRNDPPAALFIQTLVFVAFNRVVTAQYFCWWMALAPLVAPRLAPHRRRRCGIAAAAWTAAQLHWLAHAAALEFGPPAAGGGGGAFLRVWGASLAFFGANVALIAELLAAYRPRDLRQLPPAAREGASGGARTSKTE